MRTDAASNWTMFRQFGDEFLWGDTITDVTSTNLSVGGALLTLSVPRDVRVLAILSMFATSQATSDARGKVLPPDVNWVSLTMQTNDVNIGVYNVSGGQTGTFIRVLTNTAAQIRAGMLSGPAMLLITTIGWRDRRGKDD